MGKDSRNTGKMKMTTRSRGETSSTGMGSVTESISPQNQSNRSTIDSMSFNRNVNRGGQIYTEKGETSSSRKRFRLRNPIRYVEKIPYVDDDEEEEEDEDDDDDDDEEYSINRRGSSSRKQRRNIRRKSNRRRPGRLTIRTHRSSVRADQESGKQTILSWLIDSGSVPLNGQVCYMNWTSKKALLDGKITRDGILCSCCSKVVSVSEFQTHARSNAGQPYQHIFIDKSISLLQCQMNAWNTLIKGNSQSGACNVDPHKRTGDLHDDTCGICGDGGDLICCDACPSTFHQGCLGLKVLPMTSWFCPLCLCKFCGVTKFNHRKSRRCRQCEEKYHRACVREEAKFFNGLTFCGESCRKLFEQLQRLVGVKNDVGSGVTWSLIRCVDHFSTPSLSGHYAKMQCNSTLAVALAVMEECFLPIIDLRTGVNMMKNIICNRRSILSRLNYSGFFTAVLERGDEVISAASIRIHGTRLAEMPFIGTRNIYRRQGMCRNLLNAIESALRSLGVKKLIIPSIPDRVDNWIRGYGFTPIEEQLKEELRSLNLVVFPETVQLQKVLLIDHTIAASAATEVDRNIQRKEPLSIDLNLPPPDELEDDGNALNSEAPDKVEDAGNALNSEAPDKVEDDGNALNSEAPDKVEDDGNALNSEVPDKIEDDGNALNSEVPDKIEDDGNALNSEVPDKVEDDGNALNSEVLDKVEDDCNALNSEAPDKVEDDGNALNSEAPAKVEDGGNVLHSEDRPLRWGVFLTLDLDGGLWLKRMGFPN